MKRLIAIAALSVMVSGCASGQTAPSDATPESAAAAAPAVGETEVDCGPLDQATCDRVVARLIAEWRRAWRDGHDGPPPDVPILSVVIGPGGVTESGCVWEYEISWPGGGRVVQASCP